MEEQSSKETITKTAETFKSLLKDESDFEKSIKQLAKKQGQKKNNNADPLLKSERISKYQRISGLKNTFPAVFASRLHDFRGELIDPETQLIHGIRNSLLELNELRYCLRATKTDFDIKSSADPKFYKLFKYKEVDHPCFYEDQVFKTSVALHITLFGKQKDSKESSTIYQNANNYHDCMEQQIALLKNTDVKLKDIVVNDLCVEEKKKAQNSLNQSNLIEKLPKYAAAVYKDYNWSIYHPEYLSCLPLRKKIEEESIKKFMFESSYLDLLYDCKTRTKCFEFLEKIKSCLIKNNDDPYSCQNEITDLFDCGITKVLIDDIKTIKHIAKNL